MHRELLGRTYDPSEPATRTWWAQWGDAPPASAEAVRAALCAVVGRKYTQDPACVLLREPALHLFGGKSCVKGGTRKLPWVCRQGGRGGGKQAAWDAALRETAKPLALNESAARHDDGRCWAITPQGWTPQGYRGAGFATAAAAAAARPPSKRRGGR